MTLDSLQRHFLMLPEKNQPLGLYIHVPFCASRCAYCTFASIPGLSLLPRYIDRLLKEITNWGNALCNPSLDTLYIGGGTPSALPLNLLQQLSQAIHSSFNTDGVLEASLEANPGSIDPDWLAAARSCGWDRISLGVQTLDDTLLARLGRIHLAYHSLDAIKMCINAGFARISADLLIGAPGQHLKRVLDDAERLADAGAEHLSIYMLDLDKPCLLKSQVESGMAELPPEDEVAEIYLALHECLPKLGLRAYEISNFSRPGCHSMHNTRYWKRLPYLGLGPSAASNIGDCRWAESENISEWISGAGPPEMQRLSASETLAEIPLLALRTIEGADWQALRKNAEEKGLNDLVDSWEAALAPYIERGFVMLENGRMRLTPEGMLLSNQVLQIFV